MNDIKGKRPIKRTQNIKKTKINKIKANKSIKKSKQIIMIIAGILVVIILILTIKSLLKPSLETIKDSVVMLEVYNDNDELISTGSGFCAYDKNYIVTNFHVIEGASSIVIITDDQEKYDVNKILIFDSDNDLAILETDAKLKPLKFGSIDTLKAGNKVIAIGSPLGELNTVSTGIISNTNNDDGIQITASISQGSSGGALFNNNNKLIGITYATLESGQNLNYAISIDYLKQLYRAYQNGDYVDIEYDYYESCMHSDDDLSFKNCVPYSETYYSPESFYVFAKITNLQNRYNYQMENGYWSDVYKDLSYGDRELALSYYQLLEETYFCEDDCNIDTDIKNWEVNDFMINLNVLTKEELAFVLVDLENYNSDNSKFYRVEAYPLEAAEKTLILNLIADRPWDNIHKDNKEDIFNYFEHLYTPDFGAILETLGYRVQYNNDGTLTAWW